MLRKNFIINVMYLGKVSISEVMKEYFRIDSFEVIFTLTYWKAASMRPPLQP